MKARTTLLALIATGLMISSAQAALVAYFPVNASTDSSSFLDDVIDDPTHGVSDGILANNSGVSIIFDATRGGDVLKTVQGHR
jgi:hypothetical protein